MPNYPTISRLHGALRRQIVALVALMVTSFAAQSQVDVGAATLELNVIKGVTRAYAESISSDLSLYLHNANPQQFQLVERKDVRRALSNAGASRGTLSKSQMEHVAQELGVAYLVLGDIACVHGRNTMRLRIVDALTSETLYSDSISWRNNIPATRPIIQIADRTAANFEQFPLRSQRIVLSQTPPAPPESQPESTPADDEEQRQQWRKAEAEWLASQQADTPVDTLRQQQRRQREQHDSALRRRLAAQELPSYQREPSRQEAILRRLNEEKAHSDSVFNTQILRQREHRADREQARIQELSVDRGDLVFTIGDITFEMRHIAGGTFTMGDNQHGELDEFPEHEVTLDDYYIGVYEVTQQLWQAVMYSDIQRQQIHPEVGHLCGVGPNYPMYYVSYNEVQKFIKELNRQTGMSFRLPTEAEWEYAARGGRPSDAVYAGGNVLEYVAWNSNNSQSLCHPVGGKESNALKLYDMSGNVAEWCQDWYGPAYYTISPADNPQGPARGNERVVRGGSWNSGTTDSRLTNRNHRPDNVHYATIGFRLALSATAPVR
ncbi:MAG: formylglycine-generating enzyme family protein [Bacteroidales bacterium]|nr:formylglycine-generating enzyme family protein [Bacteroidales bacterium]